MESKRKNRIVMVVGLFFLLFLSNTGGGTCASLEITNPILRPGDLFPSISLSNPFNAEEKRYLGVETKAVLSLEDIQADALVLQYLNTNCIHCIKSIPIFSEIFQRVEQTPILSKRIKIIGIGAGDTLTEVTSFKKRYSVAYPIIPDTDFNAYKAVHEPTVPFIVVTKRDEQGRWVVATVRPGLTSSAESFVSELKVILGIDPDRQKKD